MFDCFDFPIRVYPQRLAAGRFTMTGQAGLAGPACPDLLELLDKTSSDPRRKPRPDPSRLTKISAAPLKSHIVALTFFSG